MLKIVRRETITELVLNRPEKRNALSSEMVEQLTNAVATLKVDEDTRVVILSGAGSDFCSGHDLIELRAQNTDSHYRRIFSATMELVQALTALPQPVIAKIRGSATAAGCQLVAAADLAICDTTARFCTPGVNLGLFCSTPMVPLARNLARKNAFEMLFLGDWHSAEEAHRFGLVNRVVPPGELDESVEALALKIAEKSPAVVAFGKQVFYGFLRAQPDSGDEFATAAMCRNMGSADAREGIDAFLEKRQPEWRNEAIEP